MNRHWRRYARFWGARVDADVDDELAFHIEMRTREFITRGMSEADARAAALGRLGNVTATRDACLTIGHRRQRRMTRAQTIDSFVQDVRYALRTLARQKAWTAVALLTLALGIGASTAVFSVVHSLLLHPLAYTNADRVVSIWRLDAKQGFMSSPGLKMIRAWQQQSHDLEAVEPFRTREATLQTGETATQLHAATVQRTFMAFTGVPLVLGRTFLPEEEVAGGNATIISEGLWHDRFEGDRGIIGRKVTIDDKPFTVVGVAANDLRLPTYSEGHIDLWLSFTPDSTFSPQVAARVRAGIPLERAAADLDSVVAHAQLREAFGTRGYVTKLAKPGDFVGFQSSLYLLAGAVALLLVVACANVAHLLIARGATRERELAIRTALGAGRRRLLRQLVTESLLLAGCGCILGVAIAYASVHALVALRPPQLWQLSLSHMSGTALGVAVLLSAITGLVFGLTAAIPAVRRTTSDSLRGTALAGTAAPATHRLRSFLVVTEMALSGMLLVGAVLLTRSVMNLQRVDPGFDTRNLYALELNLPRGRYSTAAAINEFAKQLGERIATIPGVVSGAHAQNLPPDAGYMMAAIETEGSSFGRTAPNALPMNTVAPGYFSTLGLRVNGRPFDAGSPQRSEIIVNEAFATKAWPGQNAVGRRVRFPNIVNPKDTSAWLTIVGVAGSTPLQSLSGEPQPMLYYPYGANDASDEVRFVVRAKPGTNPLPMMRQAVASLDRRLPPATVKTMASAMLETIATQRFTMELLLAFASLAVLLSAIGLYGVISYVVAQRTREIGIRIALGATPRLVARAIVQRAMILSAIGLVLGLVASIWATKLITSALYGVTGTDALSYAATGVLLLGISLVACTVPMRRAMRVDPVIAMRGE
jgi:putative ABC transport system permease protein